MRVLVNTIILLRSAQPNHPLRRFTCFPEATAVRFNYLPALRALLVLNHGQSAKAIEELQTAAPYRLGVPPARFLGSSGPSIRSMCVDGFLAAHQGAEAATKFQKSLDHRGVVISGPIGALAPLQLGKA